MLGKHFALLGSTGTGKSTSAALILHRICDMRARGPYRDDRPARRIFGRVQGPPASSSTSTISHMPYWLMNFEEHCEVFVTSQRRRRARTTPTSSPSACSQARSQEPAGRRRSASSPSIRRSPTCCRDLTNAIQHEMGKLDKATDTAPYHAAQDQDRRAQVRSALPVHVLGHAGRATRWPTSSAKIFRMPGAGASRSRSSTCRACRRTSPRSWSRCSSRLVFDYAIWSRSEEQRPILLVCEEAHRYVPNEKNAERLRRCARSSSGSPRKAANTASRSA